MSGFDDEWFREILEIIEDHVYCWHCYKEIKWSGRGNKPKFCSPAHAKIYRQNEANEILDLEIDPF